MTNICTKAKKAKINASLTRQCTKQKQAGERNLWSQVRLYCERREAWSESKYFSWLHAWFWTNGIFQNFVLRHFLIGFLWSIASKSISAETTLFEVGDVRKKNMCRSYVWARHPPMTITFPPISKIFLRKTIREAALKFFRHDGIK